MGQWNGWGRTWCAPGIRRREIRWLVAVAVTLFGLTVLPASVSAQDDLSPRMVLAGGLFKYDIEGHGSDQGTLAELRFRLPLGSYVAIQPALGTVGYTTELDEQRLEAGADSDVRLLLVDFQVQLRYPFGDLTPHVGLGAGGALDLREDRDPDDYVVSSFTLAGGAEYMIAESRFGLLAEARHRWLDETRNSANELVVGVVLRF